MTTRSSSSSSTFISRNNTALSSTSSDFVENNGNSSAMFEKVDKENKTDWRHCLPSPLNRYRKRSFGRVCLRSTSESVDIYIIGTSHVGNNSANDVRLLLETLHPDLIFLELCDIGYRNLKYDEFLRREASVKNISVSELVRNYRKQYKNMKNNNNSRSDCNNVRLSWLGRYICKLIGNSQKESADSLGSKVGGEFTTAHQYWQQQQRQQENRLEQMGYKLDLASKQSPPFLILGDRPISITMTRAMEQMSTWEKSKFLLLKPLLAAVPSWLAIPILVPAIILSLSSMIRLFPGRGSAVGDQQ